MAEVYISHGLHHVYAQISAGARTWAGLSIPSPSGYCGEKGRLRVSVDGNGVGSQLWSFITVNQNLFNKEQHV